MYHGAGTKQRLERASDVTRARRASGQPADAAENSGRTLISKIRLCQSMCIYVTNSPVKFHADPI